ncbi:MAG: hypothetical protein IMZ61_16195 [Planctomycetes bacterium]|nr:hypothetical protein [Planctomycetota bacterium]
MELQKEWYPPGEIIPTVFQLTSFVLPNLDDLRLGTWPVDPTPTGYIDNGKGTKNSRAPFENAIMLAAEIDERLSKIVDSVALTLFYTAQPPWTIQDIARSLHYREDDLGWEMSMMLRFIAGIRRKTDNYPTWKAKIIYKKRYILSPRS